MSFQDLRITVQCTIARLNLINNVDEEAADVAFLFRPATYILKKHPSILEIKETQFFSSCTLNNLLF